MAINLDLVNDRGMQREGTLNTGPEAQLADGKGLLDATTGTRDDDPGEDLHTGTATLNNLDVDLHRVARTELGDVVAHRGLVDLVDDVAHSVSSPVPQVTWCSCSQRFRSPSAGLSPVRQDETFLRTRRINKAGVSIIMVEQNARRCLQICDRGYVLDQGKNAYSGTGKELADDPKVIELYLGTLAKDVDAQR